MPKPKKSTGVQLVLVDSDHAGQRIDNFLSTRLKGVPKSAVYKMIRTGQVRINGGRCRAASRVEKDDEVRIPPAYMPVKGETTLPDRVIRQIEESVLFENRDLLVINKPSGMAVHSGSGLPWGLIDVLRQDRQGEYIELVHRLDRETSGCLVLARNGPALRDLSGQFRNSQVQKRYLCLLNGQMSEALIEVDAPLRKVQSSKQGQVEVSEQGKPALTRFHMLQAYPEFTYAEVELFTGRTHQIRAHAKHIGLPLAGDEKYGSRESVKLWRKRGLDRIFLHAHRLGLNTPTGESLTLDAPLPAPLRKVLDGLEL